MLLEFARPAKNAVEKTAATVGGVSGGGVYREETKKAHTRASSVPFSCATKRVPPIKGNARFPENNGRIEAHSFGKRKLERESEIGEEEGSEWRPRADSIEPSGSLSAKVSLDARVKYKTLILKSEVLESRCVLFRIRYNARN